MTTKEKTYANALLLASSGVAAGDGPTQRMQKFVNAARALIELDNLNQEAIGRAIGTVARGDAGGAAFRQPLGGLSADVQYDVDGTRRQPMSEQRKAELKGMVDAAWNAPVGMRV